VLPWLHPLPLVMSVAVVTGHERGGAAGGAAGAHAQVPRAQLCA